MNAYTVTVAATATPVCPTAAEMALYPNSPWAGTASVPASIHVQNTGANTIYLGGSGVTTATGFPLTTGASIEIDMQNDALYAIAAAPGELATVLRTS